jgi:hypothetical protein
MRPHTSTGDCEGTPTGVQSSSPYDSVRLAFTCCRRSSSAAPRCSSVVCMNRYRPSRFVSPTDAAICTRGCPFFPPLLRTACSTARGSLYSTRSSPWFFRSSYALPPPPPPTPLEELLLPPTPPYADRASAFTSVGCAFIFVGAPPTDVCPADAADRLCDGGDGVWSAPGDERDCSRFTRCRLPLCIGVGRPAPGRASPPVLFRALLTFFAFSFCA